MKFSKNKGRHYIAAVILFVGVIVSGALFLVLRTQETNNMSLDFNFRANTRISDIKEAIEDNLDVLRSVGNFYLSSQSVERGEFKTFTEGFIRRHPDIKALIWMPRIPATELKSYQEEAYKDGYPDFKIKEYNISGDIVDAEIRSEYFPIYYVEPFEDNKAIFGLDFSTNPAHVRAMEKAVSSGELAATGGIKLLRAPSRLGCKVFLPVYRKEVSLQSPEERRNNLVGFLAVLFDFKEMVNYALEGRPHISMDTYLYDEAISGEGHMLYYHMARTRRAESLPVGENNKKAAGGFSLSQDLRVGNNVWIILCRPAPKFFQEHKRLYSWSVLAIGLILTLSLLYNILLILNRAARVESLVKERTAELNKASAELTELNKRLEFILGATKTGIDVIDSDYNMVYIDPEWQKVYGEYKGKKCYEYFMGAKDKCVTCNLEKVFATKQLLVSEEILVKENNRPVQVISMPFQNKEGNWLVAEVNVDISERKKIEKSLRENEEKLNLILNSSAEAIYGVDLNGNCTFCNKSCLELLGYRDSGELIGKNMHWQIHYRRADGTPFPIEECNIFKAFKKGENVHADNEVLWRSDGTSFSAEYWSYPQRVNGVVVGAVVTFLDITERKKMEEARDTALRNLDERIKEIDCLYEISKFSEIPGISLEEIYKRTIDLLPKAYKYPDISCARIKFETTEIKTDNFNISPWKQAVDITFYGKKTGVLEVYYLKEMPTSDEGPFLKEERRLIEEVAERLVKITESRLIENELKESEEKFRAVYESSKDAVMILTKEGFLDCNKSALKLFGFNTVEEFAKTHPSDISPPVQPGGRDSRSAAVEHIDKAFQQGHDYFEWVHRSRDGTDFQADVLLTRFQYKGKSVLQATVRDITERKNAEEIIASAAREWSLTFDAMADGVSIHGPNFEILNVNNTLCQLLGKTKKELIGQKCFQIFHSKDSPIAVCPLEKTKTTKQKEYIEVFEPTLNKWLAVSVSPVFDEFGNIIKVVHIIRDITERKRLEKAKDDFVSMVSHELRTPLTAINESIKIVLDGSTGAVNEEQKDFLDTAKNNVERLARLINSVLDFQRLQSGRVEFKMEDADINSVIKDVASSMLPLVKNKGLELYTRLDENIPTIPMDRDKIIEVLTNLVNNAIKFTDKGSITIISEKKYDNAISVSVQDTGIGIKKEDLDKLFASFSQVAPVEYRKTGSSGLGLAISKEIILKHGGKIWVESEPGRGSSFIFVFPVVERRKG